MKHQTYSAVALAAVAAMTLACSQGANAPTSPAGSTPVANEAGADGATLKVTAPVAVAPIGGAEIDDLDPDLVINNSTGLFVQNLPLSYVFEVIDEDGGLAYRSNPIAAGPSGRTTHEIGLDLRADEVHTWRAYAVYDGRRGPMSTTASFKTLSKYGVSCVHTGSPIGIVSCRAEQHGGMDQEELVDFLREVAYDLNRLGISDRGGFGLAVKTVGNNCLGYSCDIICEGQGDRQNQYDVLIDERIPHWVEVQGITVRQCEIIN